MSFGANLQFMRKMHNKMTQEELAEKMAVSRQTVSKWEMDAAFPEMEKAIVLSQLFNCSLDDLFKENLNSYSSAYENMRIEKLESFQFVRYAVISAMPEDDAKNHMMEWAVNHEIETPEIIGWDFPFVSQEQSNVFRMHGYCAACILPKNIQLKDCEMIEQPQARYAAITIKDPFRNPFALIPNAYKTLFRYIEVNGLKGVIQKELLSCFEKEYEINGISYMDIFITLNKI